MILLTVGMTLLPSIHPRMATERKGPTADDNWSRRDSWRLIMATRRRFRSL